MIKNSLINIKPKTRDKVIKDENFSNAKKNTLLLTSEGTDENIHNSIKKIFEK